MTKDHTWNETEQAEFNEEQEEQEESSEELPTPSSRDSYYNDSYFQQLAEEDEDEILNGEYDESYFIDLSQTDEEL